MISKSNLFIINKFSEKNTTDPILKHARISTPLGDMIALVDQKKLHLLQFADSYHIKQMITSLHLKHNTLCTPEKHPVIDLLQHELNLYFEGQLKTFTTKLHIQGTDFQKKSWSILNQIPYGTTISYLEQAQNLGNQNASRAVANANGANKLAIILPCHRVIRNNGLIGGYNGEEERKQWLLKHEKKAY